MHNIISFIKKYMSGLLIISILIGYKFTYFHKFNLLVMPGLMTLLFCSFLSVDLKKDNHFQKELLYFPILNWIIFPLILLFFKSNFDFDIYIGLFLAVISPPALGSAVIVSFVKGNLNFSLKNIIIYNIISPLSYALLIFIFFSKKIDFNYFTLFSKILFYILIPLILSIIIKKTIKTKKFVISYIIPFKGLLQLLLILISVASASATIDKHNNIYLLKIFGTTTLIAGCLYLSGFLFGKTKLLKKTLPITTGHKNTLLSIMVALDNFSSSAVLSIICYLISHHLMNSIVLYIYKNE